MFFLLCTGTISLYRYYIITPVLPDCTGTISLYEYALCVVLLRPRHEVRRSPDGLPGGVLLRERAERSHGFLLLRGVGEAKSLQVRTKHEWNSPPYRSARLTFYYPTLAAGCTWLYTIVALSAFATSTSCVKRHRENSAIYPFFPENVCYFQIMALVM